MGLDECLDRLEDDCQVALGASQRQLLKTFKKKRNKLEHFRSVESPQALKSSAYSVLSFLVSFIDNNLAPETLDPLNDSLLREIRSRLGGLKEFIERREADIRAELQSIDRPVIECPSCLRPALALEGEGAHCLFCGYRADGERASADYVSSVLGVTEYDIVKDGAENPLHFCPECDVRSLVHVGPSGDMTPGREYVCFNCGREWLDGEFSACTLCGEPFAPVEDEAICSDCFDQVVNKDD